MLKEFYWSKDERFWGRSKKGRRHNLWVALGRNKRGRFLVFTKEKEDRIRHTFIQEGREVEEWWRMTVALAEVAGKRLERMVKDSEGQTVQKVEGRKETQTKAAPVYLCCPTC